MNPRVSLLISAYNNTEYLQRCLLSAVNQTLKDIEIIILDDGSTDPEAVRILDEFVESYPNVFLDRHENIGCGASLNRGLEQACGEYIAQMDCDDELEPYALEFLWNMTSFGTMDLVKASYSAVCGGSASRVMIWDNSLLDRTFDLRDLDLHEQLCFLGSSPSLWTGLYRREWLIREGIQWQETPGALFQDTSFTLITKALARKVRVSNVPVYRYNVGNSESSVHVNDDFMALAAEYDAAERIFKRKGVQAWEAFGRIRYSGMLWMLQKIPEGKREACAQLLRADMLKETIFPDFYSRTDLEILEAMNVPGLR